MVEDSVDIYGITGNVRFSIAPVRDYREVLLPPKKHYRYGRDSQKDILIVEGLNLRQIREELIEQGYEITRETIRKYIIRTGQYGKWKKAKRSNRDKIEQEKIQRKNILEQIASQINEIARQKVPEEDRLAYDKADFVYRHTNAYSFDELFSLFKAYYDAKKNHEKKTLEELSEECGIFFVTIGRLLKKAGEKPFYETFGKRL